MEKEKNEKKFAGKSALVVGGTGGIGRAVALGLASAGARLVVHGGFSQERLAAALADLQEAGAEADGFLLPITGAEAAAESAPEILRRFEAVSAARHENTPASANMPALQYADTPAPPSTSTNVAISAPANAASPTSSAYVPDILVYAYGPFMRKSLQDTGEQDWQFLVTQNLIVPGALVSAALPSLIARRWGRILLFGGTNTDTIRGFSTTAAYSAAKTGLGVLAKSAAKSGGGFGVTCNVICPGLVDTDEADEAARAYNREKRQTRARLTPEDIARASLAILSNPAINGAILPVDQGLTL